ncbi:hypothetical protein C8J57DRAFT_1396800, partial [Mycena rebaudengoi]
MQKHSCVLARRDTTPHQIDFKPCFLTLCWFCSAASAHVYSIAKHTGPIGTKDLSSLALFPDCAQDSWSPVRLKAF